MRWSILTARVIFHAIFEFRAPAAAFNRGVFGADFAGRRVGTFLPGLRLRSGLSFFSTGAGTVLLIAFLIMGKRPRLDAHHGALLPYRRIYFLCRA